jgi:PAS domain S-box
MKKVLSVVKKNFIIFIALLSIFFVAVLFVYFLNEKESITASVKNKLSLVADFKQNQITEWYADEVNDIAFFPQDEVMVELIEKYLKKDSSETPRHLKKLLNQIKSEHYYSDVILFTPQGRVMLSATGADPVLEPIEKSMLDRCSRQVKCVNTDLFKSSVDNRVYIDFLCPFTDVKGHPYACMICRKSLDEYINTLISMHFSDKSAQTFLVKKDKYSRVRIYKVGNLAGKECWALASDQDEPSQKAALGYKGYVNGKDGSGVFVCSYVSPIPGCPWSIVVQADRSELFRELYIKLAYSILLLILLIVSMYIGFILIYKSRREKIFIKLLSKEVELRKYQERFKATMDVLGEGIITFDSSGLVQYLNLKAEELTGWQMKGPMPQRVEHLFVLKDKQCCLSDDVHDFAIQDDFIGNLKQAVLFSKEGREIPVSFLTTAMRGANDSVEGYILSFRDETERKRQEDLLLNSEASYKYLFENNPHPMWVFDVENFRILSVNKTAIEKYGYTKEEFLTMTLQKLVLKEETDDFIRHFGSKEEIRYDSIFCHKLKNGENIFVRLSTQDMFLDARQARLVLVNDVTQTVKYEKELIEAKEKAERSERLKTSFLANMSHEIRTPLNGILGFANLLNEEVTENSNVKQYSKYIIESGNRLLILLNNILDVSKIESGVENLNLGECSPAGVVREVYNFFLVQANDKNVEFKLNIPVEGQNLIITTDELKLSQILTNLLSNALKFTSLGFVEVGFTFNDKDVEFFVKDSGTGISSEQQALIFERFYQADSTFTNYSVGVGLGLAICKGFAKLMKGSIRLDSVVGKGSVFYLTIPVKYEQ